MKDKDFKFLVHKNHLLDVYVSLLELVRKVVVIREENDCALNYDQINDLLDLVRISKDFSIRICKNRVLHDDLKLIDSHFEDLDKEVESFKDESV